MPQTFLSYLRGERDRLDRALAQLRSAKPSDWAEIVSLRRQIDIVDDQLTRWTRDLSEDAVAA